MISNERVMQVVNEALSELIQEEQSVSQVVMDATHLLSDYVIDHCKENRPMFHQNAMLRYKTGWGAESMYEAVEVRYLIDVKDLMANIIPLIQCIDLYVWTLPNEDFYYQNNDILNCGGMAQYNSKTILLTIPMWGGELKKDVIEYFLTHEVEHMFQYWKQEATISPFQMEPKELYKKAIDCLDDESHPLRQKIAYLIYFFDNREIDAMAHECYTQLQAMPYMSDNENYNSTRPIDEYNQYYKGAYKALFQIEPLLLSEELKYFGVSRKWFLQYMKKQHSRFINKMRKVYGLFKSKLQTENTIRPKLPNGMIPRSTEMLVKNLKRRYE